MILRKPPPGTEYNHHNILVCIVIRGNLEGLTTDSISPAPTHFSRHKLVTDDEKINHVIQWRPYQWH